MVLSTDERALLTLITQSPVPVVMSDFFHELSPAEPGRIAGHPAVLRRQIQWYRVSLQLWQYNLVRIVVPANGERGAMVETTEAGRAALATGSPFSEVS
ncbi:hypothetical protein ABT112_23675 [Streptomyces sp. NPDC002055]|uniref:hypothetical protein n=1 Tax=Streptomyces sp. NPDC002055 TaxID=3154534 RepID=UPI00331EDF9D